MGSKGAETETTYQYQPIPGSEEGYGGAMDYWQSLMQNPPAYPGGMMSPQETGAIGMYGNALGALFGQQGAQAGGGFGAGLGALQNILSPGFTNVNEDPVVQAALQETLARTRRHMAGAGLQYGTSLGDAEMRAAADLIMQEQGRRTTLQAGVGQFMTQFPMDALQQFMPMAGLEGQREYAEWLRQQQMGAQAAGQLGGLGISGIGQPMPVSQTQTPGGWDWLEDLAKLYMMYQTGGLAGAGAGAAGGYGDLYNQFGQQTGGTTYDQWFNENLW